MNAPDPLAALSAAFPEAAEPDVMTPEQLQAAADEYQRAAIADAQSEAAWLANEQEYRNDR